MYMHRFLYVYIYIYICVCMCLCVCVFMYTCLFIYIYIYYSALSLHVFFSENQLSLPMWNKFAHPRPTCSHIKELWKYALLKDQRIKKNNSVGGKQTYGRVFFCSIAWSIQAGHLWPDNCGWSEWSMQVCSQIVEVDGAGGFPGIHSRPKSCNEVFFGTQHC